MKIFVHCAIEREKRRPPVIARATIATSGPRAADETDSGTAAVDADDSISEVQHVIYTKPGNVFLGTFFSKQRAEFFAAAYDEFEERGLTRSPVADGEKLEATRQKTESDEVVRLDVNGRYVGYLSGTAPLTSFGINEAQAPNDVNQERAVEPAPRSGKLKI